MYSKAHCYLLGTAMQLGYGPVQTLCTARGMPPMHSLDTGAPPCHRRMVITTLSSMFCLAALQRKPDQCRMLPCVRHSRWLSKVLRLFGSARSHHPPWTPGASIGQVWTRHLAPAAPASRPSSPSQFHDCLCHADSALQFVPSLLPRWGKSWAASTGFIVAFRLS